MLGPARPRTPDGSAPADPSGVLVVGLGDGVRAGFSTRAPLATGRGGTTAGAVPAGDPPAGPPGAGGANLGLGVGDEPHAVRRRRLALAAWAGGPVGWATQVHGTHVAVLPSVAGGAGRVGPSRDHDPGHDPGHDPVGEADAVVAGVGTGAAVVVADCVPVLLADPDAGVVAAVHAGRRGLADGVVQAAAAAMVTRGARAGHVRAAVGPSICGRCYEVPAGLRDEVADVVPGVAATTSWGTPALDLPQGVAAVLRTLGVRQVHVTGICTYTDDRFYSHRRSQRTGEPEGRFAGVVRIGGR